MSWPTKILPFRKAVRPATADTLVDDDEFPRFHKELARGPISPRPVVVGFGVPPGTGK